MLVLSRKVKEDIVIDGVIRVRVIEINGNRVRLGIEAPSEVSVLRGELWFDTVEVEALIERSALPIEC